MKVLLFALLLLPLALSGGCAAYGAENRDAYLGEALEPFFFPFGDGRVSLGADMEDVVLVLGNPLDIFEIPSCAFDGTDAVFRFQSVQIHAIPEGGASFVHTIVLLDDTVATAEGIMLGSSIDELLLAYGGGYSLDFGMRTFARGATSISFLERDGYVFGITYELDLALFDWENRHER